jgi:hypothetical protein
MNENCEINQHEPYTIEDVSCISIDIQDILNDVDAPECIICRLSDYEEFYEDLSKNTYCKCNFYYHESCYEEWLQYKKQNTCLICDQDISSNFYIPKPVNPLTLTETMTRREILLLRNTRIRHRDPYCEDLICNIMCCKCPIRRKNSCITCILVNEIKIKNTICCGIFILVFMVVFIIIYLSITTPWVFTGARV